MKIKKKIVMVVSVVEIVTLIVVSGSNGDCGCSCGSSNSRRGCKKSR